MSRPYEEILDGASLPRPRRPSGTNRFATGCTARWPPASPTSPPRNCSRRARRVQVSRTTAICPDLALITAATQKLLLAVEIVSREDHRADTVVKKEIYEKIRVPRLWMVDPRYDNVEIYHSTEFGLQLKGILAGSEVLAEKLVPEFQIVIAELFAAPPAAGI